jgi:hypothetical protein
MVLPTATTSGLPLYTYMCVSPEPSVLPLQIILYMSSADILTTLSKSVIIILHSRESSTSDYGATVTSISKSGIGVVSQMPVLCVVGHTHLPEAGHTSQQRTINAVRASISVVAK